MTREGALLVMIAVAVVLLALGAIAHGAALRALGLKPGGYKFAHGAEQYDDVTALVVKYTGPPRA